MALDTLTTRLEVDGVAQFNSAMTSAEQRVKTFGTTGKSAEQVARDMMAQMRATAKANVDAAEKTGRLTTATRASTVGMGRLAGQLTTAAAASLPVNANVTRLAGTLGSLAMGGTVMAGVLLGATALSAAWDFLTKDARLLKEAAEDAAESIREMWLQEQTQGDIKLIQLGDDLGAQLDELARKIREVKREQEGEATGLGIGPIAAARKEIELQAEFDRLFAERQKQEELLARRRAARQEAEEARAAREAERLKREADAVAKDADQRVQALTKLQAAGVATAEQTRELREAQAALREVVRGGTTDAVALASAWEDLTRIGQAFTASFLSQQGRMTRGPGAGDRVGRLRVGGGGTVRAKNLPNAAEEWDLLRESIRRSNPELTQAAASVAGAFGNAAMDIVTHTSNIADAVTNMVRSILTDLARLVIQRQIVKPIFDALMGSSVFGGAVEGVTGASNVSHSVTPKGSSLVGAGSSVVVHMAVPITVQTLDSRTAHEVLQEHSGSIGESFVRAFDSSTALQQRIRGRG